MALAPATARRERISAPDVPDIAAPRRRRLELPEAVLLAVFAAVSVWVLAQDLFQVIAHGRVWTGTDGLFIADQMQYLAWIRDASHHGLASDLFVLNQTPHDYLQPAVAISALLTAFGVTPWLSLMLWKPVAVVAAFFAIRGLCHRMLIGRLARTCALALALFYGFSGTIGDEWLPFWSWGYPFGLMAIAAMIGSLLVYRRARRGGARWWLAPLLGLLAAWLHPWQGETLIVVVIGGELLASLLPSYDDSGHPPIMRRLALAAGTVVATALPLLYYGALDHFDPVWRLGRAATDHGWGLSGVLLSLIPLLAVAALAYLRRPRSFLEGATMVWPFATLAIYLVSNAGLGATPLHAFAGVTIPLAILAVGGVARMLGGRFEWVRGPRAAPIARFAAIALVAGFTIPAGIDQLRGTYHYMGPYKNDGNFIRPDEQRALNFLARDSQPGGVLAPFYLGMVIPELTGRHTYIGDYLWSVPSYPARFTNTFQLFKWPWSGPTARAFVLSTGARFVLADCHGHAGGLTDKLRPIMSAIYNFGCSTIYEVKHPQPGATRLPIRAVVGGASGAP